MLETIVVIMVVLWLLALVSAYNPAGGLIHIPLVIALAVIVILLAPFFLVHYESPAAGVGYALECRYPTQARPFTPSEGLN